MRGIEHETLIRRQSVPDLFSLLLQSLLTPAQVLHVMFDAISLGARLSARTDDEDERDDGRTRDDDRDRPW